jgi:hypothetical protein
MNGHMEYAAGSRGGDTFPESWGTPEGRTFSPERAAWIRERVTRDPQVALRRLDAADKRLLTILRLALLNSKRDI